MIQSKLGKKLFLVALLLLALWLLIDDEASLADGSNSHHLAVYTALHRHPPCLRIYRALLEFNLMLWGLALSLWLWKGTVGEKMTGHLLFQPADHNDEKDRGVYFTEFAKGKYRRLRQHQQPHDDDGDDGDGINDVDGDHDDNDDEQNGTIEMGKFPPHSDGDDGIGANDPSLIDDDSVDEASGFEYSSPPSAISIAYAASDFLVVILLSLFLFTLSSAEGGRYLDGMESMTTFRFIAFVAAPIFPLVLFFIFCVALVFPWDGKRRAQWKILSYTIGAPLYHVTFRDGFIGDILTSSVRPFQDVAFTVFYLCSGLQGWWQQSYDLDAADLPLESNWFLHTLILPMCMMSPLWYRFCQNLRQTYEHKTRWPYLGNALKYFIAAEVGIVGVYMQSSRQSTLWLLGFVAATCYQIWWDVFMDWNLLQVDGRKDTNLNVFGNVVRLSIPTSFRLRKTRIYSVTWLYWTIFFVNIVLRFCWTLSFLPPHYLNRAGVLSENFDGDLTAFLNPIIASAEIIRRTVWGWLRVEWEAIKVARKEPRLKGAWSDHRENEQDQIDSSDADLDSRIMAMDDMLSDNSGRSERSPSPFAKSLWNPKKMYEMTDIQVIVELCIYATIFTGLGLLAAAHRETF